MPGLFGLKVIRVNPNWVGSINLLERFYMSLLTEELLTNVAGLTTDDLIIAMRESVEVVEKPTTIVALRPGKEFYVDGVAYDSTSFLLVGRDGSIRAVDYDQFQEGFLAIDKNKSIKL